MVTSGALVWETTISSSNHNNGPRSAVVGLWTHVPTNNNKGDASSSSSYCLVTPTSAWDAATGIAVPDTVLKSAQSSKPKPNSNDPLTATTMVVCNAASSSSSSSSASVTDPLQIEIEGPQRTGLIWRTGPSASPSRLALINSEGEDFGTEAEEVDDDTDSVTRLALLTCQPGLVQVLATTKRGTTHLVSIKPVGNSNYQANIVWTTHEGLGHIQSALLVDSSHYVGDLDAERSRELLNVQNRWKAQWQQLVDAMTFLIGSKASLFTTTKQQSVSPRSHLFGFVKTAVLLSSSQSSRVYGVDTIGPQRGTVRYVLDLPHHNGMWTHRMLHGGGAPIPTTAGGGGGGGTGNAATGAGSPTSASSAPHHRDILVISTNARAVHWLCFDGATGAVHQRGESDDLLSSPVIVQAVPTAGVWPCRQSALLLLQDGTTVAVPPMPSALEAVDRQLQQATNGFYVHSIQSNGGGAALRTFHVSTPPIHQGFPTHPIGSTTFPGEDIVRVAYPKRDEAIESPSLALGDDSLLLKYLNPHLVVILTMKQPGSNPEASNNTFMDALRKPNSKSSTEKTFKRKPTGVSDSSSSAPPDSTSSSSAMASDASDAPNFFVNLVDSVSGRLLYRISHTHALSYPIPTALISENWIFYSFANEKTRRAEVGVLSLYEGMIDSAGLTAFTAPELSTAFSSLDARHSKPVVLAKTYSLARPVTALGMTATRSGISSRRLVVASVDGRVYAVDRKALEPRRPVGPLKDSEKKEGLAQYSEYIPFLPYATLSYNLTVEGVQRILTAPTDLESQTLILAYGGPDIFFTRTSPSRGFDLLPDSFNRELLLVVVVALVLVTLELRQRVSKKFQRQAWL